MNELLEAAKLYVSTCKVEGAEYEVSSRYTQNLVVRKCDKVTDEFLLAINKAMKEGPDTVIDSLPVPETDNQLTIGD